MGESLNSLPVPSSKVKQTEQRRLRGLMQKRRRELSQRIHAYSEQ